MPATNAGSCAASGLVYCLFRFAWTLSFLLSIIRESHWILGFHAQPGSHIATGFHYLFGSHTLSGFHPTDGSHLALWISQTFGSHILLGFHPASGSHEAPGFHDLVGSHAATGFHDCPGSHNTSLTAQYTATITTTKKKTGKPTDENRHLPFTLPPLLIKRCS